MAALPTVGGSDGTWGTELNEYLGVEHDADGTHGAITPTSISSSGLITATSGISLAGPLGLGGASELTIASGSITPTKSFHTIDTESDAATDNLDTITAGSVGDVLILMQASAARDITVRHGQDNIALAGGADFAFGEATSTLTLVYRGGVWNEVSRSVNA